MKYREQFDAEIAAREGMLAGLGMCVVRVLGYQLPYNMQ